MKKIVAAFAIIVFVSCNNAATEAATDKDTVASAQTVHANGAQTGTVGAQPLVLAGCYQMVSGKDTADMQLDVQDSTVTGTLQYRFYEKDRNNGTLKGVLRNDQIIADYIFSSEGTQSVRTILFQIKDGALVEGIGERTGQGNKSRYVNNDAVQFPPDITFKKTICR